MKLVAIVIAAVVAVPAVAHARSKVKAHIECSPDGGAKIRKGQKVALDKDIYCIVVYDGRNAPPSDATASLWLVEKRSDGPFNTQGQQGAIVGEDDMTYWQFEQPFHHGSDFQPCTGFTVNANVVDDQGPLWEGTFAIAAKCEKPKPLKAELDCTMNIGDAVVTWPGKGDKLKPRMEGELDCAIRTRSVPVDGSQVTFVIEHADGSKTTPKTASFEQYPGSGTVFYGADTSWESDEYLSCSDFTLTIVAADPTGQPLWTGKHKFKQTCPD